MSLQGFFPKTLAKIEGKGEEHIVLSRAARSNTVKSINVVSNAMLKDKTQIANGDLLTCGKDRYLVAAIRRTHINTVCQAHKVNCDVEIVRIESKYEDEKRVGDTEVLVCKSPSIQSTVTAQMKMFDAGLGANVVKKFLLPIVGVKELDRIRFNGLNYQVDSIDNTGYEGLLYCQCSIDKRRADPYE